MTNATGHKLINVDIPGETLSLKEFEYETLDKAIERLTAIRDQYPGKNIRFSVQTEPYSNGYEFYQLQEERRETDEERDARVAREEQFAHQRRERELAELERLRKLHPNV